MSVGILYGEGDYLPAAQVQDGTQIELTHRGAHLIVELRHIGEPLLVGAICVKPAVQYILRQMLGSSCRPGAAPGCILHRRLSPQAATIF